MEQTIEEFCITTFKRLDTIKGQLKARYEELEGHEPTSEDLAWRCFYFWNLTTNHVAARHFWYRDDADASDHAPYIPPELRGERSERIQAMDARLQEVLGDTVEMDEDQDTGDDEDQPDFDFQPGADEQIYMVEYGSIMLEHRDFVEHMNTVQFWDREDGWLLNIVHKNINGFDSLMTLLWNTLQTKLRQAQ